LRFIKSKDIKTSFVVKFESTADDPSELTENPNC
jgi:hypothetical protein